VGLFCLALILGTAGQSGAGELRPTIILSFPASPGFDAPFALDHNLNTDYASAGGGTNTFLTFDFGGPVSIGSAVFVDRRTSGNANGNPNPGATSDHVTSFNLRFSNDPTFASVIQTVPVLSPTAQSTQRVTINGGGGVTARYVQYQVTGNVNGNNVGAADFFFHDTSQLHPTILKSAPAFPGFGAGFVQDGLANTDYASNGQGTKTFIDFNFTGGLNQGAHITDVLFIDRQTSGGANGVEVPGALGDRVLSFDLLFSNDPDFGSILSTVHVTTNTNQDTVSVPLGLGIDAQFVRFQVTGANGNNVGASEIAFFGSQTVPEPGTFALFGVGVIGLLASFGRRATWTSQGLRRWGAWRKWCRS
jgi:hypothetical protein